MAESMNANPIPTNIRVILAEPEVGGRVGVSVEVGMGVDRGTEVGTVVGEAGLTVGVRLRVGVGEIIGDGVREADGVDSPSTASPLLRTINFLVTVIRFPLSSFPWMLKL